MNPSDIIYYYGWPCLINTIDDVNITLINSEGQKYDIPKEQIIEFDKELHVKVLED